MERRTCQECGRPLDFLMSEHDVDPFERVAGSPWLLAAVAWLICLAAVGLEAILR